MDVAIQGAMWLGAGITLVMLLDHSCFVSPPLTNLSHHRD
jgi:hypothetical protein